MTEVRIAVFNDEDMRDLRTAYAIGFTKSAIRRAIELGDNRTLAEALELLETI